MAADKKDIYIDVYELHKVLYSALMRMTKADRVIIGDAMLRRCGDLFGHYVLAYESPDDRLRYIDAFVADFEALKAMVRLSIEENIVLQEPMQLRLAELVAKIDEGVGRWRNYARQARAASATGRERGPSDLCR